MNTKTPRLIIAGLSGDSGKTIVSLGLIAALRRQGLTVAPFKKGPDYIDPAWLGFVAGTPCRNLDTYLAATDDVRHSFISHAAHADIAVIEGNRGLFDGKDLTGSHSTAGLAKLLRAPVVLVLDATKATRTLAAMVMGCQVFDPELHLAGVILNKIAGPRHEKVVSESISRYCRLPVLGSIPKLGPDADLLPGRHLGLVPPAEFAGCEQILDRLHEIASSYLNLDQIRELSSSAPSLGRTEIQPISSTGKRVTIGYFADSVFTFYYPENLEALQRCGANLVPISSLADSILPEIDALYIGGGFPETHAQRLADNRSLMASVKDASERGLPIYAECGGLIYLSRSLRRKDSTYPMAGVFPIDLSMHEKPVGHGYTLAEIDAENPYFPAGTVIKGHEFHYSGITTEPDRPLGCMKMLTGVGVHGKRDGLVNNATLACYTHIHADGVKEWAPAVIANAERYAAKQGDVQRRRKYGG
jgi:cobyrinic acid a,c-diamide synthase